MTTKRHAKIKNADILCIRRLIFTDLRVDEWASPRESSLENVIRPFPGFFLLNDVAAKLLKYGAVDYFPPKPFNIKSICKLLIAEAQVTWVSFFHSEILRPNVLHVAVPMQFFGFNAITTNTHGHCKVHLSTKNSLTSTVWIIYRIKKQMLKLFSFWISLAKRIYPLRAFRNLYRILPSAPSALTAF